MVTQSRVLVIGSINMDLVARCNRLPEPGETVTAQSYGEVFGGKGANQAIAAAKSGGRVRMIGRVGDDLFAERLRYNLESHQIDCQAVVTTCGCPSGLALITVEDSGENQIIVIPGANARVGSADADQFAHFLDDSHCLLLQLEIPLPVVAHAIDLAKQRGLRVILDPAPVPSGPFPPELYQVDMICPNESEAMRLTGVKEATLDSMQTAARVLHERGSQHVAITLGEKGTLLFDGRRMQLIESTTVTAVDTTGAGDAFAGALAVRWSETDNPVESVRWANIAGALAASRHGAQNGIPGRSDIERMWRFISTTESSR